MCHAMSTQSGCGEVEGKEELEGISGGTYRDAWEALCFNRGTARNGCSARLSTCGRPCHTRQSVRDAPPHNKLFQGIERQGA